MAAFTDFLAAASTLTPSQTKKMETLKDRFGDIEYSVAFNVINEVQSAADSSGTGGTFALTFDLPNGETFTTAAVAFGANAATIESAVDTAASGVVTGWTNGDITVAGTAWDVGPITFTFDGVSVASRKPALIVVDDTLLTGGSSGAITVTTDGQTTRPARQVLHEIGILFGSPPVQGTTTAVTKGGAVDRMQSDILAKMAEECAIEDTAGAVVTPEESLAIENAILIAVDLDHFVSV